MAKKILLFGGAFDPPHLGHILLVKKALELVNEDELWLLPAYQSTFGKQMSLWQDRVAMLETCFEGMDQRVTISLFEIEQQLSGSTYETISLLKKKYPEVEFSFLMGSDQISSFTRWEQWQELLQLMHFYVYPRKGFVEATLLPGMTALSSPEISAVSSSEVRQRLEQGKPIDDLVAPSVEKYVRDHHLYQDPDL